MDEQFFCVIFAASQRQLIALHEQSVDVFQQTAHVTEDKKFAIDGLLTLGQVSQLVKAGYQVLVKEEAAKHSRAHETLTAEAWIKNVEGR